MNDIANAAPQLSRRGLLKVGLLGGSFTVVYAIAGIFLGRLADRVPRRYVMAGVFAAKTKDGVRVAVNGAGPGVFRQTEMERALSANWSPDAIADIKQSPEGLNGDIHGSAEYRAHLVSVMAKRAVTEAG